MHLDLTEDYSLLCALSITFFDRERMRVAEAMPITAPPNISVGQWTPAATLDVPIIEAKAKESIPSLLLYKKRTVAKAK